MRSGLLLILVSLLLTGCASAPKPQSKPKPLSQKAIETNVNGLKALFPKGEFKIHHIGLVVKSKKEFMDLFQTLFGMSKPFRESDSSRAMVEWGGLFIELTEPKEGTDRWKNIQEIGSQIDHLCVTVNDIAKAQETFTAAGIRFNPTEPWKGFNGIALRTDPTTTKGIIIEVMQLHPDTPRPAYFR